MFTHITAAALESRKSITSKIRCRILAFNVEWWNKQKQSHKDIELPLWWICIAVEVLTKANNWNYITILALIFMILWRKI